MSALAHKNSPKQYLYAVEYIRAIASLAVAIFHLGGKALPVLKLGWLGVEMFFVLSGFIICWSIPSFYTLKSSGTFIIKRLTRIEPPYIISLLLLVGLNCFTTINYKPEWSNILLHLGYLNSFFNRPFLNPVYWTLGFEFQFYIFIALAFPFIIKHYGKWFILLLSIIPLFINIPRQTFFNFFPLFGLGILTFLFLKNYITRLEYLITSTSIIIVGVFILGWMQISVGVIAVIIILLPLKRNKIVHFLSKISFSLYLTHDIIGSRLVVYLGTQFPKTTFYKGAFFLTGIAVSILFAWLYYIIIEKPFYSLSKSITYNSNQLQPILS